jgi:hypothetical protein
MWRLFTLLNILESVLVAAGPDSCLNSRFRESGCLATPFNRVKEFGIWDSGHLPVDQRLPGA